MPRRCSPWREPAQANGYKSSANRDKSPPGGLWQACGTGLFAKGEKFLLDRGPAPRCGAFRRWFEVMDTNFFCKAPLCGHVGQGFSSATDSLRNSDLALTEVMEFAYNFYAEVEEKSTGIQAFEILIDRYNGIVYPEPGPNMMWNTKNGHMGGYGMMGSGMMGPWGGGWRGGNQQTLSLIGKLIIPVTAE